MNQVNPTALPKDWTTITTAGQEDLAWLDELNNIGGTDEAAKTSIQQMKNDRQDSVLATQSETGAGSANRETGVKLAKANG